MLTSNRCGGPIVRRTCSLMRFFGIAAPNHGTQPAMLLQWANGGITPIVFPGGSRSPHWPLDVYWPQNVRIDRPVRANAKGNVVFSVGRADGSEPRATYWWDAGNQTTIPVRLKD